MIYWTLILILLGTSGALMGFSELSPIISKLGKTLFLASGILLVGILFFVAKGPDSNHFES